MKYILLLLLLLEGCASMRPQQGIGYTWQYNFKTVAENTFRITVRESRFSSSSEAEELFRTVARMVSDGHRCRDYKILSQSRYLESALLGGAVPIVEGDILCLKDEPPIKTEIVMPQEAVTPQKAEEAPLDVSPIQPVQEMKPVALTTQPAKKAKKPIHKKKKKLAARKKASSKKSQ